MTSIVDAAHYLFTSESVTEGHPDKMCDQISDAILDAILKDDPEARVACEAATTTGVVVVLGEITTSTYVEFQSVVRDTIRDIGYTDARYGFDYRTCGTLVSVHEQSPDIARGVDDALETRGRVPAGWEQAMRSDPHADVLRRAGLCYEGKLEFEVVQRWTVESLIGFAYSTSLLNRSAVGDRAGEFERDLRKQLSPFGPDGGFDQRLSFAYEFARRV